MDNTAFCFDLDGTLTTTEILPCIAAELGVAGEIDTLTRLTMDGHIPFEDSMRLRTLILGRVSIQHIHEIMDLIPLDTELLSFVKQHSQNCFVVTGNLDIWVSPLVRKLGCGLFSSRANWDNGSVRLDSVLSKDEAIKTIRNQKKFDQIIAIGDGANDADMLRASDLGVAYGGVHTPAAATIDVADLVIHDAGSLCKLLRAL